MYVDQSMDQKMVESSMSCNTFGGSRESISSNNNHISDSLGRLNTPSPNQGLTKNYIMDKVESFAAKTWWPTTFHGPDNVVERACKERVLLEVEEKEHESPHNSLGPPMEQSSTLKTCWPDDAGENLLRDSTNLEGNSFIPSFRPSGNSLKYTPDFSNPIPKNVKSEPSSEHGKSQSNHAIIKALSNKFQPLRHPTAVLDSHNPAILQASGLLHKDHNGRVINGLVTDPAKDLLNNDIIHSDIKRESKSTASHVENLTSYHPLTHNNEDDDEDMPLVIDMKATN